MQRNSGKGIDQRRSDIRHNLQWIKHGMSIEKVYKIKCKQIHFFFFIQTTAWTLKLYFRNTSIMYIWIHTVRIKEILMTFPRIQKSNKIRRRNNLIFQITIKIHFIVTKHTEIIPSNMKCYNIFELFGCFCIHQQHRIIWKNRILLDIQNNLGTTK